MSEVLKYFVTYWRPLEPVLFWNRSVKGWVPSKSKNCIYNSKHGAAVAAGHIKQGYSGSELQRNIVAEALLIRSKTL